VLAASSLLLANQAMAADYSITGESNTFLRMKTTVDDKDVYPLFEYLRLSVAVAEKDGCATSLHIGGWGRLDMNDTSTREGNWNGDLQYGYISHQGAKNNLLLNAGRQFVTEGVASERMDGLYLRSDFAAGFKAAAFVGAPVVTEPNFSGGEYLYGGRFSQGMPAYYSIGVSALKSEGASHARDREEEGVDLWIHPMKQVDLTGRSSYNSLSSGWMEHAYTLSISPMDALKLTAHVSNINYEDYFFHVTTSALSLTNGIISPNEELTTAGVGVSFEPMKNLTVAADYRKYLYEIVGDADYFGGKLSFTLPDSLSAGFGAHRMEGAGDRLRYNEYRLYALKKLGAVDLAADFFDINYDRRINGVWNSFAITASAGYRFDEKLRVWADLEYAQSPDFDDEVRGLVKVAYAFDMKRSEGRGKSEK
jgi:opacity protein-like surface antigen